MGLETYRNAIRAVFDRYLALSKSDDLDETIAIFDTKTDNYLMMAVGWQGQKRIHSVFVHLRIIDNKIHVEWNGTEDLIDELVELGIPETEFVPAFRHPALRRQLAEI